MVILGRELKPGGGGAAEWQPQGADAHLSGAAIAAAASGLDLETQVQWYHDVLGLQLISLADGTTALLAADLKPGSFRLELLGPPEDAETLPPTAPTPSTSASSGGAGGGGAGPPAAAAGAAAAAAFAPGPALATGFGHFSLVVPSTAVVLDALRAAGRADLILEECAAVIPVRSRGHSWTDRTSRIRDINGYAWQLMEVHAGQVRERLCSVMLHVSDLRASLQWYTGVLGFRLHQSYESRETGYLSALVGFGPELQCTLLELRQQWQPAASSGTAAPAVHAGGNAEEDAAAVLVDLPSPRARRAAPAAPSAQQLVRFMVEKPDLQAAADGLKDHGQPFEVVVLSGSEDPASSVPAVALADADGWTFCMVEAAEEEEGKGGGGGRMAMEE